MTSKRVKWAGGCGCASVGMGALGAGGLVVLGVLGLIGVGWYVQETWEATLHDTLRAQTGGEVDFGQLSLSWSHVAVHDLYVQTAAGESLVKIDEVALYGDPFSFTADRWTLDRIQVHGVRATLRKDGDAWVLPENTVRLLAGEGGGDPFDWPALAVPTITVDDVQATATSSGGTLSATFDALEVRDVEAALSPAFTWKLGEADLTGLAVADESPIVRVATLKLLADGTLAVDGVDGTTSLRADGRIDLPPVVEDYLPTWAGGLVPPPEGGAEARRPWFGLQDLIAAMPWRAVTATATNVRWVATDDFMASPTKTWDVTVTSAKAGPLTADALPFEAEVKLAGGVSRTVGKLHEDGLIEADTAMSSLNMPEFGPYLDPLLAPYKLKITSGQAGTQSHVTLRGSVFSLDGRSSVTSLAFSEDAAAGKALGTASQLLAGKDEQLGARVVIQGDLYDPDFRPVRALIYGVADPIVGQVTDALGETAAVVTEAATLGAEKVKTVAAPAATTVKGKLQRREKK